MGEFRVSKNVLGHEDQSRVGVLWPVPIVSRGNALVVAVVAMPGEVCKCGQ